MASRSLQKSCVLRGVCFAASRAQGVLRGSRDSRDALEVYTVAKLSFRSLISPQAMAEDDSKSQTKHKACSHFVVSKTLLGAAWRTAS